MHNMVEAGGFACCMMRYATSRYLLHIDINNQYGYAMIQCLTQSGFKRTCGKPTAEEDSGFLEVDLEYP